jgi:hypothetical protein
MAVNIAVFEENPDLKPKSEAQLQYIQQRDKGSADAMAASSTAAAVAVAGGAESTIENTNTDWVNKKWRPMMGWVYMVTCFFDFVLAPILWSIIQALANNGVVANQWQPLTLQGAGLYHVAMGAVLGIAAYGRTKEKIESKA